MLVATILCAFGFMGIKFVEYKDKLTHHTIVAKDSADGKLYVYDGHLKAKEKDASGNLSAITLTHAHRAVMPDGPFDVHWMSAHGVEALAKMEASGQGAATPAAGTAHPTTAAATAHSTTAAAAAHGPASQPHNEHAGKGAADHGDHHGADYTIPAANISQNITYGPWKNIFYACYFATTGVHGLHVVGGIVALVLLLGHALRGKILAPHTEYIGLYWHFVDLVWIFLFPLLYLI
jgi:hypothetical protein